MIDAIDDKAVGVRLEALRRANGVTRTEFSGAAGLDVSTYAKIVRAEMTLQARHAYRIARRFGADMNYLYDGRLGGLRTDLHPAVKRHMAEATEAAEAASAKRTKGKTKKR